MSLFSSSANKKMPLLVIFYALPGTVMAMPLIPALVIIPAFYADTIGIGLAQTGLILLIARITDMISDPAVGWLSERVQQYAEHGRKYQMMLGGLLAGFALYQLFTPAETASGLYLFVWYSLMLLGWTLIQVPYLAWVVDLTKEYERRVTFNAAREFSGLIGILILGGFLMIAADLTVSEQLKGSAKLILVIGICSLPFLLFLPSELKPRWQKHPYQLFSNLMKNRLFLRLLMAWFLNGASIGIAAACFPLFVKYGLGLEAKLSTYLIFIYFVSAIAGVPVWFYACRVLGKHRAWGIAMIIACSAFAFVPFLSPEQFIPFALICLITGIALGADLVIPPAIQTDVADWDHYLNKIDRSSFLFSLWGMVTKLSLGLGAGGAYLILGNPEKVTAGASGLANMDALHLAVIYGVVPAVLKLGAVGMMWNFPLDAEKHSLIRDRLDRRNNSISTV